jgi:hypothetical protein
MVLGSGIRDPESGIRNPGSGKTYSGSRIQGSKRHRIPDPDPQHCFHVYQVPQVQQSAGVTHLWSKSACLHVALEHEHPVEAVALLAAGVGLQGVAVAGLQVLRVHCVHGARTKRLVRLNK